MDEDKRYKKARKKVEELKGFYIHLFIYILVNLGMFIVNIVTTPGELWFYWPLFGWGIGILAHAMSVFGIRGLFGKEWEERKIKQIMEKEEKKETGHP